MLGSDPDGAMDCANELLASRPGNLTAYMIKGVAYCADNDQEKAQGMLRRLKGKPKLRKRLIAGCKARDITLVP
jgi:hypothetical protein